ncbi:recombinase family protein [Streptomyces sp. NPDC048603]|uniref:recombinase family protein n=1 Tax=Streptomyces sp. NPDC048603 TaxID=3365577 RepID=UPI003723036C
MTTPATNSTLDQAADVLSGAPAYLYGYARVSTQAQDLTRQIDRLSAFGVTAENLYVDKRTGTDFEREGLADVLSRLRPGDILALDSLDRLGRTAHKMGEVARKLLADGVHLVVLAGALPFDSRTSGTQTQMALATLSFLAEVELIYQRERRASARASRETRGKTWGRPREVDRAAVLADLDAGLSANKTAAKHGIGRATVFRIKAEARTAAGAAAPVVPEVELVETDGPGGEWPGQYAVPLDAAE